VNSAVYALSTQGTLYALDAKAGTILQKIAAGSGPGESQFNSVTDLGAGQGILVVPSGKQLIAFAPMSKTTAPHK
jgi:outer membrane protein assembly factor BamB